MSYCRQGQMAGWRLNQMSKVLPHLKGCPCHLRSSRVLIAFETYRMSWRNF